MPPCDRSDRPTSPACSSTDDLTICFLRLAEGSAEAGFTNQINNMQSLSRLLLSQLRPHVLQGSPAVAAAAAAWCAPASIRLFSSEGLKRLFVGNLNYDTRQEDVKQAFEKFGTVKECGLPMRQDGRNRGFGFVEMDEAAADAAIAGLDQSELDGRTIVVKPSEPNERRGPRPPRSQPFVRPGFTRLYVGNLNFRTTAADLGRHFQQFGAVQDCVIPLDTAGRSKGFAFVELDDEGAAAAMTALNGQEFEGRPLVVRTQGDRQSR